MARYRSILRAAAALVLFLVVAWGADAQDILIIDRDGARWKSGDSEEPSITVTSSGIINALPPTSGPEPRTPELAAVPSFAAGRPVAVSDPQLVKAALAKPSEGSRTLVPYVRATALPLRPPARETDASPPLRAFLARARNTAPSRSAARSSVALPTPRPLQMLIVEPASPADSLAQSVRIGLPPPSATPETLRRRGALDMSGVPASAMPVVVDEVMTFFYGGGETGLSLEDRARLGGINTKAGGKTGPRVEIHAYSGSAENEGTEARRKALLRAIEVRRLLIARGVPGPRIVMKAAGIGEDVRARVDIMLVERS
ncbi:MAG: hypothetical protein OXF26_03860 [Alphaproteobacteria bacterium]|nr:hypothetical protein [Alphaproteobacteria bacterium]MCY4319950.1 hypothetical protein [Alphaproteobacteria bacterium]